MKIIITTITALGLLAAAAGLAARECGAAEDGGEGRAALVNPHDFSREDLCSTCHSEQPPLLTRDPVTTCVKCHHGNIGNHPVTRHPMGLIVNIRVPAKLPLTDDGEMVCHTCHEPHGKAVHPGFLRVEYMKLCALCHTGH
ncbi:hypothetical protein KJ039_05480 [bacterium]|nr:hypothetical protein [bacterium]